ncbi:hypothetical protein [Chryseobacterium defluvii]|uniref:Uncharacterized protein n=1 Tax=Chryseobacterium defluvii TaxID=160396 RepID=A0A495SNF0_9FLAO|nr:hypothetical protein [Chryseobacterium defluvii]RKT01567.1 hypothetical protein BCF58_0790 [Chryseobacterium defluvii]
MRKNYLRLFLLIAFLFTVYSCVHDEVYSAENAATVEYHSKSLWKEDEKYIKNIIKIYSEHESEIKRVNGVPQWDYAMSMGKYDETFMVVPIVENNKVVSTLSCARFDKKVYFKYENSEKNNEFFNSIIFGKYTQVKPAQKPENDNTSTQKGSICVTQSVSLWYPNSETDPNSGGHWETNYYTNCYSYLDYSDPSWESGGSGGFDYGGGGGSTTDPNNPQNLTPCEKTKSNLNKPNVQQGISDVKDQAKKTLSDINAGEIGFKEKKDGTIVPADVNASHKVVFNNVTDGYGAYHNHTATGTHMFSPPDIADTLFGFAAAQSAQDGVGNAYFGMIAAEWCNCPPDNVQYIHYVINYAGTGTELGSYVYTPTQMNKFVTDYQKLVSNLTNKSKNGSTYIKTSGDLNEKGLEKLFLETLKIMNLSGKVNLQRVEPNGTVYNVAEDINGMPVGTPCP